jgi:hypothetical protein
MTIDIHLMLVKTDLYKLITFIEILIELNAIQCIHDYLCVFKCFNVRLTIRQSKKGFKKIIKMKSLFHVTEIGALKPVTLHIRRHGTETRV